MKTAHLDKQISQFNEQLKKEVKIPELNSFTLSTTIVAEIQLSKILITEELSKNSKVDLSKRYEELIAFQGMMEYLNSSKPNPYLSRSQIITQNYISFVYLKDSIIETLKKNAENGSVLKKCCKFLLDNPIRAFRNSIAHGNWQYKDDFSGIEFWARKGSEPDEEMSYFFVSQGNLNFWQSLSRLLAYSLFIALDYD